MKLNITYSMILCALCAGNAAAQTPVPQAPSERTGSPYDRNPACRDRDVASTDPACVIQDGRPRVQQFDFDSTKPRPAAPARQPQTNQPQTGQPPAVQPQTAAPQGNAAPPLNIVTPPQAGSSPAVR